MVRLSGDDAKAWTLLTALEELKGHEEQTGKLRPMGHSYSRDFAGPNWLDLRKKSAQYDDREPTVLVVGGGQAGLSIAARLTQRGIDTLIVDRWPRIGDNWRRRYHALTLHNQVHVNHLPYLPFPPSFPVYIPKDKLANWFEAYVEAMELNYWTSTQFLGGSYDERERRWSVTLKREGVERRMHPRHVVMATGVSGIPSIPDIPALKNFRGKVMHSSQYEDGETMKVRRAVVIGTGNSGHDIAQDLYSAGAQVTLVQRSPTLIINCDPRPAARGLRPHYRFCSFTSFPAQPSACNRACTRFGSRLAGFIREKRLQARFRRGWNRLAVHVPHSRRRLLLQRRLLGLDRRGKNRTGAVF